MPERLFQTTRAGGVGLCPIAGLPNNGLQLTKATRCAPFAFRSWGQSLRAAIAAEARCYADRGGLS